MKYNKPMVTAGSRPTLSPHVHTQSNLSLTDIRVCGAAGRMRGHLRTNQSKVCWVHACIHGHATCVHRSHSNFTLVRVYMHCTHFNLSHMRAHHTQHKCTQHTCVYWCTALYSHYGLITALVRPHYRSYRNYVFCYGGG